ncbi:DUF3617 domain-containing protein [Novosphingobium flavum]|uniref:DUF3617 domain-containing protein n=1 Tax=Novosphingobium flavum TaxID=1778672 RepID=A0A7X1FRJ0_9SPHN|nr:DUF3617 domain-containing protein [Novosphingobium flavum]MBC2665659.1 DUF3617 domain-containing protein [Novosphingobium flavum]
MRAAVVTSLAAVLALAGCKKEQAPEGPKSIAEAAKEAAGSLPKPVPGLYRSTAEILSMEMPGMPAGMGEQMKAMMGKRSTPHDFCLTGEEAAKGYEERVKKLAGRPDCKFDHYSADGGKLDARMTCTAEGGITSVTTMQGMMTPEGSDMTLGMEQSGGKMPGGAMTMKMHVKTERVGDCPKA